MKTTTPKRIVLDVDGETHRAIKVLSVESNTPMRRLILDALNHELSRRRAALVRPAPRANP